MKDWITKEQLQIAKQNGISRKNLRQRYWEYGWEIEKAITQPIVKKHTGWLKWKETAEANGVNCSRYVNRIRFQGMTPEQAATTPIQRRKSRGISNRG